MGRFGQTAVLAVDLLRQELPCSPRDAWNKAVFNFSQSNSSRDKGCPRDTFLGICGSGEIIGIPSGNYSRSKKNKFYGTEAIKFLRAESRLENDKIALWKKVVGGKNIAQNGQMDVVISLWKANYISRLSKPEDISPNDLKS